MRKAAGRAAPVPRKRPSQERATVTVDAIVTAVERVLDAHGVAGLTTNRVAEIAGVSVGTLYQYFPNKQALVGALQERVLLRLFELFDLALTSGAGASLDEVGARVADAMVMVYRSQRPVFRWLIELRTEAAYQDRFHRMVDRFVERVAEFLVRRPEFGQRDARATAFAIVTAVEGVANGIGARPGAVDVEQVATETVRMVTSYLAARTIA